MGIVLQALVSSLSLQDLEEVEAELFLGNLKAERESHEPDELEKPMLISAPAPRASNLVCHLQFKRKGLLDRQTNPLIRKSDLSFQGLCSEDTALSGQAGEARNSQTLKGPTPNNFRRPARTP